MEREDRKPSATKGKGVSVCHRQSLVLALFEHEMNLKCVGSNFMMMKMSGKQGHT